MHDVRALVQALFQGWKERDVERILATLAPDVVYHNMPLSPVTGHAAVRAAIMPFLDAVTAIEFRVLHEALADDGALFNERIDIFRTRSSREVEIPVAGIFKAGDRGITLWRDYFDWTQFHQAMAADMTF